MVYVFGCPMNQQASDVKKGTPEFTPYFLIIDQKVMDMRSIFVGAGWTGKSSGEVGRNFAF